LYYFDLRRGFILYFQNSIIKKFKVVNKMPSKKVLAAKQQIVSELAAQLKNACAGVLVDYKGITVADDTKLRNELRKAGVNYSVKKNTLVKLAAKQIGLEGLDDVLNGTTALATSDTDLVACAKILSQYAEKNKKITIKAGFIEGKAVTAVQVAALAKLPPKEVLIAQILAGFNVPITGFVNVLNANLRGLVVALNAIAEKKAA
jgi:large subunit ribosomal protein L10